MSEPNRPPANLPAKNSTTPAAKPAANPAANPAAAPATKAIVMPGNAQWIGTRGEQQDAFGFHGFDNDDFHAHGGVLAVLADGMGGLQQGRAAAQTAVDAFRAAYAEKTPEETIPNALERALQAANSAVYQLALGSDGEGQVGTTLVAAVAHDQCLAWVAVGDSRLYGYRAATDSLTRLNQEHNYAAILQARVAAGALDQADADEDPERAALISFLGLEHIPRIDAGADPMPLMPGDRLLLCSDGVHGSLSDQDIQQLIRQGAQPAAEAIMASLQATAAEKAHQDNATLAILAGESPASVDARDMAGAPEQPSHEPRTGQINHRPRTGRGKVLIALGFALLLVLIGIAIGLVLRAPVAPAPEVLPEPAESGEPEDPAEQADNPQVRLKQGSKTATLPLASFGWLRPGV
ncbi:Serine/threonine phosphatase stp [Thiorhodovibrio winogradskyi]|uniref:Serine/threonine phosphatase stp n=1 Tax=Thiorhodovibrio winogradskyi TaxID=77007 RepID=A0ABZ0SBJ6_9GAMM|nr:protein phosphatase 2C domain-containing protein [Thiorhodovibrio winogradskyi]